MSQEHTPHEIQPVRTGREPSGRGVSRRSFVRLAVGALTSLPAVAGGVLVGAPAAAIAEEAARGEEGLEALADAMSSGVITVMAVRYDEVCISVVDVTRGRRRARPVAGARVKITSYYNKRSMEVTTNKGGGYAPVPARVRTICACNIWRLSSLACANLLRFSQVIFGERSKTAWQRSLRGSPTPLASTFLFLATLLHRTSRRMCR